MSETKTIIVSTETNLNMWRLYEYFRTHSRLLTTWVGSGYCELEPEYIRTQFSEYEQVCKAFIDGMIAIYNSESDTPINPEIESVTYNVDFFGRTFEITRVQVPVMLRQFTYNTINSDLINNQLKKLMGDNL